MMEENLAVCGREEMDQALSNISSHPGEGVQMRSTLKKVMLQLDLLGDNPVIEGVERTVLLKLSGEDLFELQKYVKAEGGSTAVTDVESLLVRSLDVENLKVEKPSASREQSGSNMPKFHLDVDHFNESSVIIFQALTLPCCLLLRFKLQWGRGRILLLVFILAVLQTWVHLYQEACALKHAILAKHATVAAKGCQGLPEGQGWFSTFKDFLGGLFHGLEDPCEAYYLAALVDPAWEVGLQDAFVETVSVFLVAPGKACGESLAQLLEPLPLLWKLPIVSLATFLLVVFLLLLFGYEISTPLLSIRPAANSRRWVIFEGRVVDSASQTDLALVKWENHLNKPALNYMSSAGKNSKEIVVRVDGN